MDSQNETFTLPLGPKGLCFDRNQFLGENFSVDVFLHNHRNAASLETLRDDLGIYLKVLRSAMIELINKDYADFVNLSTNLIGLDKEINNIQSPLGQLKEEVLHVRECLSEAMKELTGRLEQRRHLREKKRSLQYLSQTRASLQKLSHILFLDNDSNPVITQDLIERAASEYIQLQFTYTKCESFVIEDEKKLFERIGDILTSTLESMFLENLNSRKIDKLQRSLQIFSMLDKVSDIESMLRKKIIGPALHDIISESALQKNPSGLRGVYANILTFFDQKLKDLTTVTKSNKSIKRYNFLLNSFWPEVEYRIEVHMSSIFAPGNPELYYSRYSDSLEFTRTLLKHFGNKKAIEKFYNHPQYKNFQLKWNLPIYFRIRFQEIAGSFESLLAEPLNNQIFTNEALNSNDFSLRVTKCCWTSLTSCWAQGVFIVALTHRFWKLSLQIISRYCVWAEATIKQLWTSSPQTNQSITVTDNPSAQIDRIKFLIFLHTDINMLINYLPTFLEIIKTRLEPLLYADKFNKCLVDSKASLEAIMPQIQQYIVHQISSESIVHLKQINDIPRLFRKTNRDIPSKACGYLMTLVKSPMDFYNIYINFIGENNMIRWLEATFSIITSQYYTAIEDVLTSIQKTEDSLRRLKQIRDRPSQTNLEKLGVSDDDKIRMQLKVDIDCYVQTLMSIKLNLDNIEKLNDLINLVERATSAKSNAAIH